MRIAVLGAGAIGGTLAALLDRAGHDVAATARGEHLAAIREHGLRLDGAWGTHVAQVAAEEALTATPELAILATKAQDASAALRASAEHLDGVPILVVQNGLAGADSARAALPDAPLVGGLAMMAASLVRPGAVAVTTPGALLIAPVDGAHAATGLVERTLAAVLELRVEHDLLPVQWSKLLFNQVNALPAITGLSVQQTVAHGGLREVLTRSLRETVRVGAAAGARFAPLGPFDARTVRLLRTAPWWIGQSVPRRIARGMGAVPNPGSTLQSIRRGVPTEIDFLNGAVVDAARAAGAPAPINASITALVHEVEAAGFLAPETVVARIAAARMGGA